MLTAKALGTAAPYPVTRCEFYGALACEVCEPDRAEDADPTKSEFHLLHAIANMLGHGCCVQVFSTQSSDP